MTDYVKMELEKSQDSPFHDELLKHVTSLVDMSRTAMRKFYKKWDEYDDVYRGVRAADTQDKKAEERGEPTKMVVPLTYAQIQTFVAFSFALFYQREHFFELIGMSEEDHKPAKVGEALLNRDLTYNTFDARLHQFLLDTCKFGLGVFKTGWVTEKQMVPTMTEVPEKSLFGISLKAAQKVWGNVEKVKFQGNRIYNISPYRFFPDTRLPVCRFQEGEFIASEDEFSITTLKQMELEGVVYGIDHVKPMTKEGIQEKDRRTSIGAASASGPETMRGQTNGMAIVTEVQVRLIPNRFKIDGKPMGEEDYPVIYNVWIANDTRIIKCEPLGYLHGQFTYDVAEFNPDQHNLINAGLAETIEQLQSVITWLINSHVTSVRKTIQNWLIVDPSGLEMKDIVERRPVIRLNASANRSGVDRWVKQLAVQDVTAGHMKDAETLEGVVQLVTGINDNALGQFNTGRRSATEARNVNSATASRLRVTSQLIFKTALVPMAQKMLSNLRDGLDEETYVRVIGDQADPAVLGEFKKVNRESLVGDYDFAVFDGTLPSERYQKAQTLQDFVTELLSVPQLLPMLGYDLGSLVKEVLELRGIRNPDRFKTNQQLSMQFPINVNGQPTATGTVSVRPGGIAAEVGNGMAETAY